MTETAGQVVRRFLRATEGTNAIEFAILATPFILLIVLVLQIALYFVAQAALDIGVTRTADSLRQAFYTSTVAASSYPNGATLKTRVESYAGGLLVDDTSLAVEIRPASTLTSATVKIVDGTATYGGSTTGVLALRAYARVPSFIPGVSNWAITSTALVRRQGR